MPQSLSPSDLEQLLTKLEPGSKLELEKTPSGEVIVSGLTKEQIIEQDYGHLAGQGISMSKAAKKYRVPRGALQNWIYRKNYVNIVDEDSYPQLVDEAHIALCAAIYHERKEEGITGVAYFEDDGTVITGLKHPKLAAYRARKRKLKQQKGK